MDNLISDMPEDAKSAQEPSSEALRTQAMAPGTLTLGANDASDYAPDDESGYASGYEQDAAIDVPDEAVAGRLPSSLPSSLPGVLADAGDYDYTPEGDLSTRLPAFSIAAYSLDAEDLPLEDLPAENTANIPWRGKIRHSAGEPLQIGVVHGEEVLEAEDPLFLKTFLDSADDDLAEAAEAAEGPSAREAESALVIGVKFRQYGAVYFFKAGPHAVKAGGKVLVETEQGLGLAEVVACRRLRLPLPPLRTAEGAEVAIKEIAALAAPEDVAAAADNQILASSAFMHCKECIRERNLDMKLVDVEVLHDRSKIVFYFTAPSRIDFRDLVKDLVRTYRTRIELRQIGVRHETQMLGALGNCGMTCCCRRYLRRFAPVTIKMAKEQNLFLNPAKLSGICGRLLCCLSYEQGNYEDFNRRCPKIGKRYATERGVLKILRANLFKQSIAAGTDGGEELEFSLEEWQSLNPVRQEGGDSGESKPVRNFSDKGERDGAAKPRPGKNAPRKDAGAERAAKGRYGKPDTEALGWLSGPDGPDGQDIEDLLPEELLVEDETDGISPLPARKAEHHKPTDSRPDAVRHDHARPAKRPGDRYAPEGVPGAVLDEPRPPQAEDDDDDLSTGSIFGLNPRAKGSHAPDNKPGLPSGGLPSGRAGGRPVQRQGHHSAHRSGHGKSKQ